MFVFHSYNCNLNNISALVCTPLLYTEYPSRILRLTIKTNILYFCLYFYPFFTFFSCLVEPMKIRIFYYVTFIFGIFALKNVDSVVQDLVFCPTQSEPYTSSNMSTPILLLLLLLTKCNTSLSKKKTRTEINDWRGIKKLLQHRFNTETGN